MENKAKEELYKNNDMLENKADLGHNTPIDHTDCVDCLEDFIFKMRDNYHEFYIDMSTILTCLYQASKAEIVPQLPTEWWGDIMSRYKVEFE